MASRVSLYGLPLDLGLDDREVRARIESGGMLLTYLNPYSYKISEEQPDYALNLEKFDLIVCDGIGIQAAARSVFGSKTPILTPDYDGIAAAYLAAASELSLSLCLVGSADEIVSQAALRLRDEHPGLTEVRGFGGYGSSPLLAKEEILAEKPGMVLVGMGMGKQEAYLLDLVESGWSGIGICVGGFFDKLANPELDYPSWAKTLNMRFLGRLAREPGRLWRRYFLDYRRFVGLYLRYLITRK